MVFFPGCTEADADVLDTVDRCQAGMASWAPRPDGKGPREAGEPPHPESQDEVTAAGAVEELREIRIGQDEEATLLAAQRRIRASGPPG
jgi:hypothetical protein